MGRWQAYRWQSANGLMSDWPIEHPIEQLKLHKKQVN